MGTDEFLVSYVRDKVSSWVGGIEKLSVTQPQVAYVAFTHVFLHRWSYIARTVPMSHDLYCPLDEVLSLHFLPALTGQSAFGIAERELLSLPAHLGVVVSLFPPFTFPLPFHRLVVSQPLIDHLLR